MRPLHRIFTAVLITCGITATATGQVQRAYPERNGALNFTYDRDTGRVTSMTLTGDSESGTGAYQFNGTGGDFSVETYSGVEVATTRFVAGSSLSAPAVTPSLPGFSSYIELSFLFFEVAPGTRMITASVSSGIYFTPEVSGFLQYVFFSDTFQVTECAQDVIDDLELQHSRRSEQEAAFRPNLLADFHSVTYSATLYSAIRTPPLSEVFSGSSFRLLGGVALPPRAGQEIQQYYNPIYLAERVDVPNGSIYIDAHMVDPRVYPLRLLLDEAGFSHIVTSGELIAGFTNWELASHGKVDGSYEVRYSTHVSLELEGNPLRSEKICEVVYRLSSTVGPVVNGNNDLREESGPVPRGDTRYTVLLRTLDGDGFDNWAPTGGDPDLNDVADLLNDRFAVYAERSGGNSGHFYTAPSILSRITYWGSPTSAKTAANYFHGMCLPNLAIAERAMDRSRLDSMFLDDFFVNQGIDLRIGCANLDSDRARPDVAVGTSANNLRGVLNFGPAWAQKINVTSSGLRPVRAFATISNEGIASAAIRVSATRGNRHFRVRYTGGGSNVSALTSGGGFDLGVRSIFDEPFAISISVTPNKKTLRKRIGRRTAVIRKRFLIQIRATSTSPNLASDGAQILVRTRE